MHASLSECRDANHIQMHKHELTALRGRDVWLPPQFGRKSCFLIPVAPPVATLPCLVGSSFNNCYSKHTRKHRKRSISFKLLCLPRNLLVALVLFNRMLQPPFRRGSTVTVTCLTIETSSCVGLLKSLTFGNMFTL